MHKFLIHFDPGARGDFLSGWLTNNVDTNFISKSHCIKLHTINPFNKSHYDENDIIEEIEKISLYLKEQPSNIIKIRINSINYIPQIMYNMWNKNKKYRSDMTTQYAACINLHNYNVKISDIWHLYDYVVPFETTMNIEKLIQLYETINHCKPSQDNIDKAKINISKQLSYTSCPIPYLLHQYERIQKNLLHKENELLSYDKIKIIPYEKFLKFSSNFTIQ